MTPGQQDALSFLSDMQEQFGEGLRFRVETKDAVLERDWITEPKGTWVTPVTFKQIEVKP